MKRFLFTALAVLGSCVAISNNADAAGSIFEELRAALETPVGAAVLETSAGKALKKLAKVDRADDLAAALSRAEVVAREFQGNLRKIEAEVARFREMKAKARINEGGVPERLSLREKFLVRLMTERLMRVRNPRLILERLSPGSTSVLRSGASDSERVFLDAEPKGRLEAILDQSVVPSDVIAKAPGYELWSWTRGRFNAWSECLRNQPETQARKNLMFHIAQSMGTNALSNTVGYVNKVGVANIHISELTTNTVMTLLTTAASKWYLKGQQNLKIRWIRMMQIGAARQVLDGVVYYFDPLDQTLHPEKPRHGHTLAETGIREAYGMGWTVGKSPFNLLIHEWVNGLLCLHPASVAVKLGTTGFQLVDNFGSSVVFFEIQQRISKW